MICSADKKCLQGSAPYTIQNDDTFYKISKYYNITLGDLIEANPDKNPDEISAGDTLCIPLALQNTHCHSSSEAYTIKEEDTIFKLAKQFNINVNAIMKANPRINPDALLAGQIICIPKPWNKYINDSYKISFTYPTRWARINDHYYEGVDGFFRIETINSDLSLEELGAAEAYHKLKPYGSYPDVVLTSAADNLACLIIPSKDQPMEMKKQAALIIKHPDELKIKDKNFNHLILWADSEHLNEIMSSMEFWTNP